MSVCKYCSLGARPELASALRPRRVPVLNIYSERQKKVDISGLAFPRKIPPIPPFAKGGQGGILWADF